MERERERANINCQAHLLANLNIPLILLWNNFLVKRERERHTHFVKIGKHTLSVILWNDSGFILLVFYKSRLIVFSQPDMINSFHQTRYGFLSFCFQFSFVDS